MKYYIGTNMSGKTYEIEKKYKKDKGYSIYIDVDSTCEKTRVEVDLENMVYINNYEVEYGGGSYYKENIKEELQDFIECIALKLKELYRLKNKSRGILKLNKIFENLFYQNLNNIKFIYLDEPDINLDLENMINLIRVLKKLENSGKEIIVATHSPSFIYYSNFKISDIFVFEGSYLLGDNKLINLNEEKFKTIVKDVSSKFTKKAFDNGQKCGLKKLNLLSQENDYFDFFIKNKIESYEFVSILFSKNIYLFEGYTEKLINDLIFEKENIDKFICDGKIFVLIFCNILQEYNKSITPIVDEDREDNVAHKEMNKLLYEKGAKFFKPTLEKEFEISSIVYNEKVVDAYISFKNTSSKREKYIEKIEKET